MCLVSYSYISWSNIWILFYQNSPTVLILLVFFPLYIFHSHYYFIIILQMRIHIHTKSEYNSQEKVRDAIRARTGSLGLEESQVSKEFLAEAAARAAMRSGSGGGGGSRLDLSKISDGSSKILSINYDPEDEMTQEEMESADPLGFKPFQEQMTFEFGQTTFPDLFSTFSRVVVLVIVAFTTGFLIITTDSLVREVMMAKGFIPRPEDIINAKEAGLALSQELAKKVAADSQGLSLPDIGM